jgi:aryl-alcohol dehydrogenase-like predicted oxidoreductase
MNYRRLGSSGLLVSELALGTMIFGEDTGRGVDETVATRMIHQYLDAGGNFIDTANVYAAGRSEEIVGRALKGKRDQVVLATKVRFSMGDGPNEQGLSRYHIQHSVEASLGRLQCESIDLLYMHCWDNLTPIEEALRAFDNLVQSGKVTYIGVSNFAAWQLMKALGLSDTNNWARFVAAQYQYSLVVRDIEYEFIDMFRQERVGLVPWGALGGGFLSGKYQRDRRPQTPKDGRIAIMEDDTEEAWSRRNTDRNWRILDTINEICKSHPGASHSQISLAWLLSKPFISSVLIGAKTPEQLRDNLATVVLQLQAEEINRLDEVSGIPEMYPYRFIRETGTR